PRWNTESNSPSAYLSRSGTRSSPKPGKQTVAPMARSFTGCGNRSSRPATRRARRDEGCRGGQRATKAQVKERRTALFEVVKAMKPMTVRQVFYQATVRGIVEKSERGYVKVQTDLTLLRRDGELPYDWLTDNTRWQRKPRTHNGVEEALLDCARF